MLEEAAEALDSHRPPSCCIRGYCDPRWPDEQGRGAKEMLFVLMNERILIRRSDVGEKGVAAVTSVLRSDWLTTGAVCEGLEAAFAPFVEAKHTVGLNSSAAALDLAVESRKARKLLGRKPRTSFKKLVRLVESDLELARGELCARA